MGVRVSTFFSSITFPSSSLVLMRCSSESWSNCSGVMSLSASAFARSSLLVTVSAHRMWVSPYAAVDRASRSSFINSGMHAATLDRQCNRWRQSVSSLSSSSSSYKHYHHRLGTLQILH